MVLHSEFNELEQRNIAEATGWALAWKRNARTETFLKALHRRMFGRVWRWAENGSSLPGFWTRLVRKGIVSRLEPEAMFRIPPRTARKSLRLTCSIIPCRKIVQRLSKSHD